MIVWQWRLIVGFPGIVDSPEIRRNREKASTFSGNAITPVDSYDFEITTATPATTSDLQTFKITHDDVVLGANSIYGSQFQPSSPQLSSQSSGGGGILFAVSGQQQGPFMASDQTNDMRYQGMNDFKLISAYSNYFPRKAQSQPVLLQYLSSQGASQQSGIQYIQLLRPLMMLPSAPSYLQARPISSDSRVEMKPASNPFMPQIKSSIIGAHSVPLTTFSRAFTRDTSLNMNEYMPVASSRVSTTLYNPNAIPSYMMGYKPTNHYQMMMAQRA